MTQYIMLAYLLLFAALSNAVYLYNAFFFLLPLTFANAFCFHVMSLTDTICLFQIFFCITYSAFNQLGFITLCSHRF